MPTSILTITVATSVPPDSTNITIYISSGTTHVLIYNVLFSHIGLKTIQISELTQIIDKERTDISGWCWSGVRESKYKYWTLGDPGGLSSSSTTLSTLRPAPRDNLHYKYR